jgi:hypothetical protein
MLFIMETIMTEQELRKHLRYDAKTGEFWWLKRKVGRQMKRPAGTTNTLGYRVIWIDYKSYYAHRLAFLYMTGSMPEQVDHIDGNPSNNSWGNLRESDVCRNRRNCARRKTNASATGYTGVYYDRSRHNYKVCIGYNRKWVHLGRFNNINDAIAARKAAEERYGFSDRHGK